MAKVCNEIKKTHGLYSLTKSHTPKSRQSFGGEFETIKKDLKKRYGEDVIEELESEKAKTSERKKKDKFAQSGRDGMNQKKIDSFFTATAKKVKTEESPKMTNNIIKEEPIEVEDESPHQSPIPMDLEENGPSDNENYNLFKPKPPEPEQPPQKTDQIERSLSLEERIAQLEKAKKLGSPVAPTIKPVSTLSKEPPQPAQNTAKRKNEDKSHENGSSSSKRKREDPSPTKPSIDKGKVSSVVVGELNKHYKNGRFLSKDPRALFKDVARALTHQFFNQQLTSSSIKSRIHEIFKRKKFIESLGDAKT